MKRLWEQFLDIICFIQPDDFGNSIDKQVVLGSLIEHSIASPLTVLAATNDDRVKSAAYQQIRGVLRALRSPHHHHTFSVKETTVMIAQQLLLLPDSDRVYFAHRQIDGVSLRGKQLLLIEAVMCLVKNSLESNEETLVGLNLFSSQKVLKIVLSDFGQGMNTWQQLLVKQPFLTTKKDGMGIGLPFVKWVVESVFYGQFEILSKPALGTMVVLKLPILSPRTRFLDMNNPRL